MVQFRESRGLVCCGNDKVCNVSSANLHNEFPGVIALRSPVLMTYEAGPMADPCIMLAVIWSIEEVWPRKDVQ